MFALVVSDNYVGLTDLDGPSCVGTWGSGGGGVSSLSSQCSQLASQHECTFSDGFLHPLAHLEGRQLEAIYLKLIHIVVSLFSVSKGTLKGSGSEVVGESVGGN